MSELLAVRDLRKSFTEGATEIHVLRGVNFDLAEGERVAVVGQSGVGKSTLLHILGTLDRPTSGQILFRGKELPLNDETSLVPVSQSPDRFCFSISLFVAGFLSH